MHGMHMSRKQGQIMQLAQRVNVVMWSNPTFFRGRIELPKIIAIPHPASVRVWTFVDQISKSTTEIITWEVVTWAGRVNGD